VNEFETTLKRINRYAKKIDPTKRNVNRIMTEISKSNL
jgi:hypothetical protein